MTANRRTFRQRPRLSEGEARDVIEGLFSEWFGDEVSLEVEARGGAVAFLARVHSTRLVMEHVATADTASIDGAIHQLKRYVRKRDVPVVVVPFMGAVGRRLCAQAGVSWLDLSGNADIRSSSLRILIEGRPNRYVHLGRPATPFAPKSSRLARWLLIHPDGTFSQRDLARHTQLDPSQVSRLVARLREQRLVKVGATGGVGLNDRRLMLEAWRADYQFQQHHVVRAHVPGRSGAETTEQLARGLERLGARYALTGLAGAWSYTHFAGFRLVTAYVETLPTAVQLKAIDFVEQDRGSNVWLVLPNDRGVFDGLRRVDGLMSAHPVQVWLDLKEQPERSQDAADQLYARILKGALDG
jgi:hypothetical protein